MNMIISEIRNFIAMNLNFFRASDLNLETFNRIESKSRKIKEWAHENQNRHLSDRPKPDSYRQYYSPRF